MRGLVMYEDAEILALNKPAGLSSQGGRGQVHTLDELLWAFAKPGKARPRLIHRLDRDTSGVILTAKTKPAASFLGKALMARRFAQDLPGHRHAGRARAEGRADRPGPAPRRAGREAYMRPCAAGPSRRRGGRSRAIAPCKRSRGRGPGGARSGDRPHAPAAGPPGVHRPARSPATRATAAR